MRIIKTTEPRPTDILGLLALYNGFDCLSLPEIMPQLLSEMEPSQHAIYDFEMEMQAPLLEMEFNGSLVDAAKRQELTFIYRRKQLEIEKTLHTFCKAIGYYDYYKELAVKQYSDATNIDRASLPRTWAEWLALPIQLRKEWKKISEQALEVYQKQLKETDKPFNANSVKQKLQLFYHFFGSPNNSANFAPETNIGKLFEVAEPPWQKTRGINVYKSRGQNGEYSPSTDRECLEKIQKRANASDERDASYWAQPFISCCLAIADYTKTLGFLKCKLESGIFRSSFSISTKTGRMASRSNAQGYGWNCFAPGAEALTQEGWKPLEQIKESELVVQWLPSGALEWAPATPVQTQFDGKLCVAHSEQIAFSVTPNHRLPLNHARNYNKSFYTSTAAQVFSTSTGPQLRLGGTLQGGISYPRLIVALFADGHLRTESTRYWEIHLKRKDKIKRLLELVDQAQLTAHETGANPGYRRFVIRAPHDWPLEWGAWVLQLEAASAQALLDECGFWDGTVRASFTHFYTSKKEVASWVQTLAHRCNHSATIMERAPSRTSFGKTNIYTVTLKERNTGRIAKNNMSRQSYSGPVYCLSVPSSYFLARQHGKIHVTGNSQNITPPLRVILTVPEGYKVGACDYSQIESRNVGAICYTLFGATAYLNATESGDLHSFACSMVWDDLPWPSDFTLSWLEKHGPFPPDMIRAAKKIAGEEFYRGKSRRDVSKTLGHGSNYLGQPFQMSKHSHIDIKLVEHYQQVYFEAFPEIRQWHNHTIEQVQVYQEITTIPPFNRKRQCFGRPSDDSVIREMVAYAPQSMAADYTNRALLNIHKEVLTGKLPLKLFLQKHDEIGFHYRPVDEQLVLARVCDIMEQPYTLTDPSGNTRGWKIPVEAQVGWNLGHKGRDRANPDGLIVYQGTDERTRVKNPFNLLELIL